MSPFEVLYGRKCRTPLNWSETGECPLFGPDIIQQAEEQVRIIRENLRKVSMTVMTKTWSINLAKMLIFELHQ